MALQPTVNQKRKGPPQNKKIIIIFAIVVVAMVALITFSCVRDTRAMTGNANTQSSSSSNVPPPVSSPTSTSTLSTITDPIGDLAVIDIPQESIFSKEGQQYLADGGLRYPGTTDVAERNLITFGSGLSIEPLKSCMYQFNGSQLSIAHTSGALIALTRHGYRKDVTPDELDVQIAQHFEDALAEDITLSNVYMGTAVIGRCGTGMIDIEDISYTFKLTYLHIDSEMYTIVALAPVDDDEYLDIMLRMFKTGSTNVLWS